MNIISKGLKLSYKTGTSTTTYADLTNLLEIPDLGGSADAIEITTLEDSAHVYTNGLVSYGDSLDFVFLMKEDATQFLALDDLGDDMVDWKVSFPNSSMTCTFSGTCSVAMRGVGTNARLEYTLSIKPSTAMTFA